MFMRTGYGAGLIATSVAAAQDQASCQSCLTSLPRARRQKRTVTAKQQVLQSRLLRKWWQLALSPRHQGLHHILGVAVAATPAAALVAHRAAASCLLLLLLRVLLVAAKQ